MRLAVLALTLTACAPLPLPLENPTAMSHPRWCPQERPVYVAVAQELGPECLAEVAAGVAYWQALGVDYLSVMVVPRAVISDPPPNRFISIVGEAPDDPIAAADARVARLHPGCLRLASIRLAVCRKQTVAHELGHALGLLEHHPDPGNLMFWAADMNVDGPYGITPAQVDHVR